MTRRIQHNAINFLGTVLEKKKQWQKKEISTVLSLYGRGFLLRRRGLWAENEGKKRGIRKRNETPQRASRQVLGDLGLLFCGDEACDNREDHKRAADEHADNLHGFAVLDAIDKLVKFFKVEVLFKPVFSADLQNTAEC